MRFHIMAYYRHTKEFTENARSVAIILIDFSNVYTLFWTWFGDRGRHFFAIDKVFVSF